ncbi:MAG: hypothetical protein KDJ44_03775 [Rhodoblastus sp.]|nr:hypothetical protein [Rhodoblastus sp.]
MRPCGQVRQPLRACLGEVESLCALGPQRESVRARRFLACEKPVRPRPVNFDAASTAALEAMYAAAALALTAMQSMATRGRNPVTEALDGAADIKEWAHYPDGDARDRGGRGRYYYHVHCVEDLGEREHGHFHVFLDPPSGEAELAPTHVIGLAMDSAGRLIRLFTTNGWVTGEYWREAETIVAALDGFSVESDPKRSDLDEWVSSVLRLYRPQIVDLLRGRDAALREIFTRDPASDALEDRTIRVLSTMDVDLLQQIGALEAALDDAATG